ncbi:MAG: hypothetical protein V4737_01320 [Curtobacterium sp.]
MGNVYAEAIKTDAGFRVCFFGPDGSLFTTSWCASELTAGLEAGRWWQRNFPGQPLPPFASLGRGVPLTQLESDRIETSAHAPLDTPAEAIGQMGEVESAVAAARESPAP